MLLSILFLYYVIPLPDNKWSTDISMVEGINPLHVHIEERACTHKKYSERRNNLQASVVNAPVKETSYFHVGSGNGNEQKWYFESDTIQVRCACIVLRKLCP